MNKQYWEELYLIELELRKQRLFNKLLEGKMRNEKPVRNGLYEILGVMDYKKRMGEHMLPIREITY